MAPRTILYTGKGGVGKTSVAAATAPRCAAAGASVFVAGSAVFGTADPGNAYAEIERSVNG